MPDNATYTDEEYQQFLSGTWEPERVGVQSEASPEGVAPERGTIGDIGSNLARGVSDSVKMGGYALKSLDPDGGMEVLDPIGQGLIDASEKADKWDIMKPDESEASGEEGFIKRGIMGGFRAAPLSITAAATGFLAGPAIGLGAVTGAAVSTLGLFGLGTYGQKYQEFKDQGIEDEQAQKSAVYSGLVEGGFEALSSYAGLKIFGVDKLITQPLKSSAKELLSTPMSTWAKRWAADTFLMEVPTEILQNALGSEIETDLGLQDEGAWKQAALEAIIPAMTMSVLFGMGAGGMTTVQKRQLKSDLNNMEDPERRYKAVAEIEKGIAENEKNGEDGEITRNAEAWANMALDKIDAGEQISLNQDFIEYASQDEETLTALRGSMAEDDVSQYKAKLEQRVKNLSRFKSLNPRQQEKLSQTIEELRDFEKKHSAPDDGFKNMEGIAEQTQDLPTEEEWNAEIAKRQAAAKDRNTTKPEKPATQQDRNQQSIEDIGRWENRTVGIPETNQDEYLKQQDEEQHWADQEREIKKQKNPEPAGPLTTQEKNDQRIQMTEKLDSELKDIPETDNSGWLKLQADEDYWGQVKKDILPQKTPTETGKTGKPVKSDGQKAIEEYDRWSERQVDIPKTDQSGFAEMEKEESYWGNTEKDIQKQIETRRINSRLNLLSQKPKLTKKDKAAINILENRLSDIEGVKDKGSLAQQKRQAEINTLDKGIKQPDTESLHEKASATTQDGGNKRDLIVPTEDNKNQATDKESLTVEKEPWEMSLEEWNRKDHKFRHSGQDSYYIRSDKKGDEVLWAGTRRKSKLISKQHKYEIQRAIQQGKIESHPDYPELVKSKEKPKTETAKGEVKYSTTKGSAKVTKQTEAKENGKTFKTGTPVTFKYVHNKESATDIYGIPDKDSKFGRGFEPSGKFVTLTDRPGQYALENPKQFEIGELTFNNPLVIDNDGLRWKETLSKAYNGITGKKLSKALIKDGYDGVVTVENGHTSETVDLTTFDESKAKYSLDQAGQSDKRSGKQKLKATSKAKDKKNARILDEKRSPHRLQTRDSVGQKFLGLLGSRDATGKTKVIPGFGKEQSQIRKIAKGLGLKAIFFKTGKFSHVEGFTHPESGNEIYLNNNGRFLLSITGHESLHQLRANHPDLYDFLAETITVSDENFQKFYDEQLSAREGDFTGLDMEADKVMEELLAHFVGDQFTKPEFWAKLSKKNPTLTEKIFNVIKDVLAKIKGYVTRGEQYVSNVEELQNAVAFAYSEALRANSSTKSKTGVQSQFQTSTDQTKSPAFRKWFGESKVVDGNGDPLVVYHGTPYGNFADRAESMNEYGKLAQDSNEKVNELWREESDALWEMRVADSKASPTSFYRDGEIVQKLTDEIKKNRDSKLLKGLSHKENTGDVFRYVGVNDSGYLGSGFYFTGDKKYAKGWAKHSARVKKPGEQKAPYIYEVYLSIQNPYYPGNTKHPEGFAEKLAENRTRRKPIGSARHDIDAMQFAESTAWTATLAYFGFDGIIGESGAKDGIEYVVFNPTQIKSATGNNGQFDINNPDIRFSTTADLAEAEDSFSVEDNSSLFEDFKYNVVDMLSPVDKVYKAIKKAIPERSDFRLKEQLRTSKAKGDIEDAETKYFKPIKRLIGFGKLTVAKVDEFLYSRHATEANVRLRLTNARHYLNQVAKVQKGKKLQEKIQELDSMFDLMEFPTQEIQESYKMMLEKELGTVNERLKKAMQALEESGLSEDQTLSAAEKNKLKTLKREVSQLQNERKVGGEWKTFSEKPSGMTDAEASKLQEKWKDNRQMEKIAKIFDRMNAEGLEISHKAGRLSDEEYEAVKGTFEYYAPLFREGYEKKRAFAGIGSGIKNLGSDVKTRGGSTKRAVHLLANSFVNHEKTIINAKKAEVAKAFLNFVKENPNKDFWEFEEVKTKAAYDSKGNIKRVPAQNIEPNEVKVKSDGKVHIISANPNNIHAMRILELIQGNQHNSGPIVGALSKINRVLAAVNTTWNPEFIISNLTRDLQTAAVNLSDTDVSGMRKQIFKSLPDAMKGLHSLMRGDGSHEWAKIAKVYEKSGAKIGWIDYGRDIETKAGKLESQIDLFREGHVTKKTVSKLVEFIEDYNSIVENAVRLSTFKAGIDSGMTNAKAAIMAKGLTVNFNQKGAYGPVINSLYLFANAGIQGSTRIIKTLKNSKQARKVVGGSILAAVGLALANSGIGGDDEDGIPYYDKIDTHLKARNMIFMIPGSKGDFIKIPLPWGYNVFWAAGTELGDMFVTKGYKPLDGVSRMLSTALDAFNPLQSATVLQTLSPTIGDPFVQVGENKTFFGSPLMPEGNPFDKTPTPDSEKYWRSVRPLSKMLAKSANIATGGDKIKPGLVDVSPETIDLVFDTFTGGAGRFILDTAGLPVKIMEGDASISKVPLIRRVYGQKSEYKTTTDYRENITHVYQLIEQAKAYPEKRKSLFRDKTHLLYSKAKAHEKRIRNLNKLLKKVTVKSRQDEIKERIEKEKQRFNKAFLTRSSQ